MPKPAAMVEMRVTLWTMQAEAIEEGRCAVVGLEYALADGQVKVIETLGDIGA